LQEEREKPIQRAAKLLAKPQKPRALAERRLPQLMEVSKKRDLTDSDQEPLLLEKSRDTKSRSLSSYQELPSRDS
jgi:hypothetical protein